MKSFDREEIGEGKFWGKYIKSSHTPIKRIRLILRHTENRTIATNEITQHIRQKPKKRCLILWISHAKWCRLLDCNGFWTGDVLAVSSSVASDITKICVGKFGVE